MTKLCSVPMPKDGKIMDENGKYYKCNRPARYRVGFWYVCEEHKQFYTDPNNWEAEMLSVEELENNETI